MTRSLIAALTLVLFVGACGAVRDSRLNPFNWFKRSESAEAIAAAPADKRVLVAQVTSMAVENTPGGAILRATGLPPTQGWWDGVLQRDLEAEKPGELVFRFVLQPPPEALRASTPQSREVTVAIYLTDFRLEGIGKITVTGEQNARSTARR
jgi:hypothetical protein